jgi:hypothetical protein
MSDITGRTVTHSSEDAVRRFIVAMQGISEAIQQLTVLLKDLLPLSQCVYDRVAISTELVRMGMQAEVAFWIGEHIPEWYLRHLAGVIRQSDKNYG